MPDLLTCVTIVAKILILGWSLSGWLAAMCTARLKDRELDAFEAWGVILGTPLFIGLMGWLD